MPNTDHIQAWFAQRRFGLFLHFGLYALEGWHEQDQMRRRIPRAEYAKLLQCFNPTRFDADAILDMAQSVGMEYVCLTTKHHDGFCLWDTRETAYNVMQTPYRRDLVRQLAEACHKRNFPLGLYYSVADWHHPNYPNQGRHHELPPQPGDRPDWDAYMAFLVKQVRELCTQYGPVRHWFWDMNVPEHRDPSVNALIRELQPQCVINDRGFDAGDFGTPEREYQTEATHRLVRFPRPTEACNSVGTQSWGYRRDEDYYATAFLIGSMDATLARGGHYLLNVGPDAEGCIPDPAARILREIGAWYAQVREAFGDAEPASELTENRAVLLTRRGHTLYAHLAAPVRASAVVLAPIVAQPVRAVLLNTGEALRTTTEVLPWYWESEKPYLAIRELPRNRLAGETLVVKLEFEGPIAPAGAGASAEFRG